MTSKTYFRLSLLFPVCIPLLIWVVAEGQVAQILMLSLVLGGIPYTFFATVAWHILGRETGVSRVPPVILIAPNLQVLLQLIVWLMQLLSGYGLSADILAQTVGALLAFLPIAICILLLGYTCVGGAALLLFLLIHAGQIKGST